jgi:hypothetical protein
MRNLLCIIIGFLPLTFAFGQSVEVSKLNSSNSNNISISIATREDFKKAKNNYKDQLIEDTLQITKKNGIITLPIIKTENPTVIFTDSLVDGEEHREYHYLGQYPNLNVYLVSGSFWEHYECYLVNKKTGEITVIWNDPKISPSSEYLANLSIGFGLDGYPTGMQIWKKDKKEKELMKLVEIDQKIWAPEDFVWESENTILLKVFSEDQFWKSHGELKNNDFYYLRLTLN